MGELVNESSIAGFGGKIAIQQEVEPQRNPRRVLRLLLHDCRFQMLPGYGPLDGSRPLRAVRALGDPDAVALRVFDGQRQLSADLAAAHLERVFNPDRQGTCIRYRRGVTYIKHKQYRSPRLQDHNRPSAYFDLAMIVPPPPAGRADKVCTRPLDEDQHRIEWGIETKPTDKPHQLEIGIAGTIFTRTSEQLIERCPRRIFIQWSYRTLSHCHLRCVERCSTRSCHISACRFHSIRRVDIQSIRAVATGSTARLSHQATSSPKRWLSW